MIISDLNYLETVSEQNNLLGGKKTFLIASPITQTNVNITGQLALSFGGYASNKNYTDQSNSVKF
ncbi:MAG TPA: hypothetical protein V6D26_01465 [Stenomitos sp.]